MPTEQKRVVQSREAEPESGGSSAGTLIFCALAVAAFIGAFFVVVSSRHPDFLILVPFGVFALAGIAGVAFELRNQSDSETFGAVPLELGAPAPADATHWHATLRLPASAKAPATVHAELICSTLSYVGHREVQQKLVWGKGSSFGIRWMSGAGTAALAFEIPPGLPRSEAWDPHAERGRLFGKWELKVTAANLERNYDLDIQPAAMPAVTPDVVPTAPPDDELPDLPSNASSVGMLVAANLVLIAGVAFWGWRVKDVVFLYWIENLVIGAFNVLALLIAVPRQLAWMARQGIAPSAIELFVGKLLLAAFFVLHFGFFCYIAGEALSLLILFDGHVLGANLLWPLLSATLRDPHALAVIAAVVAGHGYSFFHDYVGRGEYRRADLKALMTRPYRRVVVIQLFILGGGVALLSWNSPVLVIGLFVAVKIALEVYFHLAERRALSTEPTSRALFG